MDTIAAVDHIASKDSNDKGRAKDISFGLLLPWIVLAISLAITWQLWKDAGNNARQELQAEFDFGAEQAVEHILQHLATYEQMLHGVQGLFAGSENVERHEFRAYVAALRLEEKFPGVEGVGFVQIVPNAAKVWHSTTIRRQGLPTYTIWPAGKRDTYAPILQLEPSTERNLRALGFDMYSDPPRRAAMERACDTDQAAVSGKVALKQQIVRQAQAGFLMMMPLYNKGMPHTTLAERRAAIIGWVYAPFRMDDLMTSLQGIRHANLDIHVYDGMTVSKQMQMYDSDRGIDGDRPESWFQTVRHLDIGDHIWTVVFNTKPEFEARLNRHLTRLIAYNGIVASLMLTLIIWLLISGRARAIKTAQAMSRNLIESEYRWRFALEGAGDGVWDWNIQTSETLFSRRCKEMLGFTEDEIGNSFDEWEERIHPKDMPRVMEKLQACIDGNSDDYADEFRLLCKDGNWKWILVRGMTVSHDTNGKPMRMIGTHTDITERKNMECIQATRWRLLELSGTCSLKELLIATLDEAEVLTESPIGFYHFLGADQKTLSLQAWSTRTTSEFCTAEGEGRHYSVDEAGVWADCIRERRQVIYNDYAALPNKKGLPPGHAHVERLMVVPVFRKGLIVAILGVGNKTTPYREPDLETVNKMADLAWDIAEKKRMENELREMATTDFLTGVYNRRHFIARLQDEMARLQRLTTQCAALLMLDLDFFKHINDTYGHATGDAMLRHVCALMRDSLRKIDTLGRIGGEEFAIILPGADLTAAYVFGERLRQKVAETPIVHNGQIIQMTVSLGITIMDASDSNSDTTLARADQALYQAKESGRNNVKCYQ